MSEYYKKYIKYKNKYINLQTQIGGVNGKQSFDRNTSGILWDQRYPMDAVEQMWPIRNGARWIPKEGYIPPPEWVPPPDLYVPPEWQSKMRLVPIRNGAKWVPIEEDTYPTDMRLVPIRNGAKWVPIEEDTYPIPSRGGRVPIEEDTYPIPSRGGRVPYSGTTMADEQRELEREVYPEELVKAAETRDSKRYDEDKIGFFRQALIDIKAQRGDILRGNWGNVKKWPTDDIIEQRKKDDDILSSYPRPRRNGGYHTEEQIKQLNEDMIELAGALDRIHNEKSIEGDKAKINWNSYFLEKNMDKFKQQYPFSLYNIENIIVSSRR